MSDAKPTQRPLTPAVLHILMALASEERHGYGIMKQVQADSGGNVKMGPGTLYGSIGRMIDAGLVEESDREPDSSEDDKRRIYYRITPGGRQALEKELDRYRTVVALAEERRMTPAFAHDA